MNEPTNIDLMTAILDVKDAMLHGFAQSEARDNELGSEIRQVRTDLQQLNTKHNRLETRVEHIETDVRTLKTDVQIIKIDIHGIQTWIARKDSKRR